MSAAIKQIVTVRPGGLVELRSPELHEGEQAEVTVVVMPPVSSQASSAGRWRRHADAVNRNDPHAADNQRIDADLIAEYGHRSES